MILLIALLIVILIVISWNNSSNIYNLKQSNKFVWEEFTRIASSIQSNGQKMTNFIDSKIEQKANSIVDKKINAAIKVFDEKLGTKEWLKLVDDERGVVKSQDPTLGERIAGIENKLGIVFVETASRGYEDIEPVSKKK